MKILVTGASGFIGRYTVSESIARGHEVSVLSRSEGTVQLFPWRSAVKVFIGDLKAPPFGEIAKYRPDAIIHCAWISTPGEYMNSAENYEHLEYSKEFLAKMSLFGVKTITVVGTCAEYLRDVRLLIEDDSPTGGEAPYVSCKLKLYKALRETCQSKAINLVWARVFYPYGPGEHPARLVSSIISRLMENSAVKINAPYAIRDYIHVQDVATSLVGVTGLERSMDVNVCTGFGTRLLDLAENIAERLGKSRKLIQFDSTQRPNQDTIVGSAKVLRLYGLGAKVDISNGIETVIATLLGPGSNMNP